MVYKINLDPIIYLEPIINKNKEILITLINSDEKKSFKIKLLTEESNHTLLYFVIIAILIFVYVYIIYIKLSEER